MKQYVVVDASENWQFPIGQAGSVSYRGLDRNPWEKLDDLRFEGRLSSRIEAIRLKSRNNFIGNLSFGTIESFEDAALLKSACIGSEEKLEIVTVDSLGPISQCQSHSLTFKDYGLDGYADGFGSVIRLGIMEKPQAFPEFFHLLNGNGLFDSLEHLKQYSVRYLEIARSEGLEWIDLYDQIWVCEVGPAREPGGQ